MIDIVPGDMVRLNSEAAREHAPLLVTRAMGYAEGDNVLTGEVYGDEVCTVLAVSKSELGVELLLLTSIGTIGWALRKNFMSIHDAHD